MSETIAASLLSITSKDEMLLKLPSLTNPEQLSLELSACKGLHAGLITVCDLSTPQFYTIYTHDPRAQAVIDIHKKEQAEQLAKHMASVLGVSLLITYLQ